MWRMVGRAAWWVIAYDRPTWRGDYLAILALLGLLLLGAVALSWPWLVEEVPRTLAAGLAVVRGWLAAVRDWLAGWAVWLRSTLPRFG